MKNFYLKIVLFLSILFVIVCIFKAGQKFYWGNNQVSTKMLHFFDNEEKYNTFFFGSSRVFRHIVPSVFDKAINNEKSSFNFGAPATFIPEAYYLYENFIDENQVTNSTLFIEVQPFLEIADRNMGTEKTIYYMNFGNLKFALNHIIADQNINTLTKIKNSKNYIFSFISNTISYTTFRGILNSIFNNFGGSGKEEFLGPNNDGYLSKEQQWKWGVNSKNIRKSRKRFLRKNAKRNDEKFIKIKENMYEKAISNESYNEFHLEYLENLIEDANTKNNKLIFILMPQTFQNTMGLFNKLPDESKIDAVNPQKFPQLYHKNKSFDVGHLNEEGATEFTKLLATEYIKLNEK